LTLDWSRSSTDCKSVTAGCRRKIRVDNGPEFISKALDHRAYKNKVILDFSRPGKPTDNAYVESFNGRLRDECLNTHWFSSLEDARAKIEAWRRDFNETRPHTSPGFRTQADEAAGLASRLAEKLGQGQFGFRYASRDISRLVQGTIELVVGSAATSKPAAMVRRRSAT
jgi:hypothetical protein